MDFLFKQWKHTKVLIVKVTQLTINSPDAPALFQANNRDNRPVVSPHEGSVMWKGFPCHDVTIIWFYHLICSYRLRRRPFMITVLRGVDITVTPWWARWRLKSPARRLLTQPFVQAEIKENTKALVAKLCEGNSTMTGDFPIQTASNTEMFPFADVIMEQMGHGRIRTITYPAIPSGQVTLLHCH